MQFWDTDAASLGELPIIFIRLQIQWSGHCRSVIISCCGLRIHSIRHSSLIHLPMLVCRPLLRCLRTRIICRGIKKLLFHSSRCVNATCCAGRRSRIWVSLQCTIVPFPDPSTMGFLTTSLHFVLFVLYLYSVSYNVQYVTQDGEGLLQYRGYGGKFKYLTFINFVSFSISWRILLVSDFVVTGNLTSWVPASASFPPLHPFHSYAFYSLDRMIILLGNYSDVIEYKPSQMGSSLFFSQLSWFPLDLFAHLHMDAMTCNLSLTL